MGKENLFEGTFRRNPKGFGFVKCEELEEEIHIASDKTLDALNGDVVLVKLLKKEGKEKSKEGRILKILKHDKTTVVGTFQNSRNFGFVVPDDKKFGTDIFISKKNFKNAQNDQKVVVQITKFPIKNKNAEGKIIEVLGNKDEAWIDMLSVIKEFNLPYEFPKKVLGEVKNIRQEVEKKDIPNRRDFRQEEIFTIDGEDAKDLDDAVSVQKLKNGNYLLSVHIADVSHYVKEGSNLDKEALFRGTSVYMFNKVIPMLPKELSNGICSLNQGEDRFTISCLMEINNQGEVISSDVVKGVICVTRRMNYHDVAEILQGENQEIIKEYEPYVPHFKRMEELAHILKDRRDKEGTLNLDIPESKIILDEQGKVISIGKYELTFANEIIEQFMLTANEVIAEKFFWLEAPFIYRVHEVPDEEKIDELNKFLFNLGYRIKGNKENIHPKAFAEVLEQVKGKEEEKVVSNLLLRTLKVARYESSCNGHFGLASKYYCHFTSPIRRYPDLFIHRVISKYLKEGYNVSEQFKEQYSILATKDAEQSSEREKVATKAEREADAIKKAEYMQDKIGQIYDGIISSITSFGAFVELENTVEGLIRFDKLGKEYFDYDPERKILIGEKTKTTYKVGDKIKIKVIAANKELRQIDFEKQEEEENL